jgi:uncharacterized protein DUF4251
MKKLSFLFAAASALFLFSIMPAAAQDTKQQKQDNKEAAIKALVDAQHYSFEAQTALPLGTRIRNLTPGYELKVRKDTIEAYLPYYGRAYSATIGSSDGGIQFKTTDFKYTATEAKKGGWNITIAPKNAGDTRLITLFVSQAGYASVQVTSNNKQSISFNGYIQ